jgi:DUF2924 family protein
VRCLEKKRARGIVNICSERSCGGCRRVLRRRAEKIADDADLRKVAPHDFFAVGGEQIEIIPNARSRSSNDRRLPIAGTLLSRKWKGRTILVEVLAQGFRYEGRPFSSLSAIAIEVTGTRWNGMAFFGLTRPVSKEPKESSNA